MAAAAEDPLSALEMALGYRFRDRTLLERAMTHSSYANESSRGETIHDNETFEFLGDSILGFLVAELLFESYPDFREGPLSKARSHLVSEGFFAGLARKLCIGDALRLAVGEVRSGGRVKDSILADAFEALFAAVYLDAGMDRTREVARRLFAPDVASLPADLSFHDYKTTLQELAQAEGKPLPLYRLVEESGPDHDKRFVYEVDYGGQIRARGEGASKKEAQRRAAKAALAQKMSRLASV
ncbi:MAG TPA: ribonuclease III [Thermoanaerobaculia bacterium]|nr:ribonuclease III [Thermoanaerobaculia bacterium]